MATFVLVHGAWHGGWCWEKVAPYLEAAGHRVVTPNLPGHGGDPTPVEEVTLDAYVERICDVIDAEPEPVVLLGHSMGGIVITPVAEARPDRIHTLVYLTAFLLPDGATIGSYRDADPTQPLPRNVVPSPEGNSDTVRREALKEIFYHDCSDEDVERAADRLVPQSVKPRQTPMRTTPENFGRVRRVYIECADDRALVPELQRRMYTDLPCERVITMQTSHSPFFSAPEELANHLMSLV